MMSKEKRRVPKLRFSGFTEDWEQRKLGDVGLVKSGVGFPEKEQGGIEGIPFYKVSDMNHFDNQFEMIVANNYVSQNQIIKNRWSPIIDSSAIIFAKVGAAVLLDRKRLCTNSFMLDNNMMAYIFYPEQLNKYFCKFLFDTINLGNLIQVGALPSLNAKDISDIKKYIPNLSEQNRIAKLLLSVETLITLHQRKLDNLKLKKKALLQKLFPKNGERYPELRFPGFTDTWEQRKFDEIMTFINGRAYKQDELLSDGKYKVLRVGNFYTNDSWYYSNLKLDDKYYAMNGDLLYTWSATFGPHIWKGEKVIYHYHIWKIVLKNKIDKLFALQLLEVDKANIMSDKNGSTMVHITKQGMENKKTILPLSLNEQKQIAKFLSSIDKLITLHQRKLDHLQLQKKALLQQMFV